MRSARVPSHGASVLFSRRLVPLFLLLSLAAAAANAQTAVDPTLVEFNPSPDHDEALSDGSPVVTRYELEFYEAGTWTPVQITDLGKPAVDSNGRIQVNFLATWPTVGVDYEARVNTVGPGGSARSEASNLFSFTGSCTYLLSTEGHTFGASGGPMLVNVVANAGCPWTTSNTASWVSIPNGSGSGSGNVSLSVGPNPTTSPRYENVTIAGISVRIAQSGLSCDAAASSSELSLPANGLSGTLSVNATAECRWSTSSSATWLTVTPSSGSGPGTVTYRARENPTEVLRTATLQVAGTTVVVTQAPLSVTGTTLTVSEAPASGETPVKHATPDDFDGDGKTDLVVWRPENGAWYESMSSGGTSATEWGAGYEPYNDVPVSGDYDGDGKTDVAVWRASTGVWYVILSSSGSTYRRLLGTASDRPVPGDYDGDGKTDVAVWHPSSGGWEWVQSSNGATVIEESASHASNDDRPVPADYDGDGKTDVAVWRASTGVWYVHQSANGSFVSKQWGVGRAPYRDLPLPADYDGDGKDDFAVWRPSTGTWYVVRSSDGRTSRRQWGVARGPFKDVPVPGDYDGDSRTDLAVWRSTNGTWYIIRSSSGARVSMQWGLSSDWPSPKRQR